MGAIGLYTHIRNNRLKSALLMAGFAVLLMGVWYALWVIWTAVMLLRTGLPGNANLDAAVIQIARDALPAAQSTWWIPMIAGTLWSCIAFLWYDYLIRLGTKARPLDRAKNRELFALVESLAITAGLPMPQLEIVETPALNAYASGLSADDATIGVTRGLLQRLNRAELEAVLAHEMTHIKNGDVLLTVVAGIFAGGLSFLADISTSLFSRTSDIHVLRVHDMHADPFEMFADSASEGGEASAGSGVPVLFVTIAAAAASVVFSVLLLGLIRLFAVLTEFAISRSREFMADAGAVELTQNPDAMISALRKISGHSEMPWVPKLLRGMMIGGDGSDSWFAELYSTHPSIDARIARLVQYGGGREYAPQSGLRAAFELESGAVGGPLPAGAASFNGVPRGFGKRATRFTGRRAA
jgi:heat shock protein HtpX